MSWWWARRSAEGARWAMEMTYDELRADELRGTTQADVLVALDAHLRLVDGGQTVFHEPGFPVVELARDLRKWLDDGCRSDFVFDSMSYEEIGTLSICGIPGAWEFRSVFAEGGALVRVDQAAMKACCWEFVARVEADLVGRGLNPQMVRH